MLHAPTRCNHHMHKRRSLLYANLAALYRQLPLFRLLLVRLNLIALLKAVPVLESNTTFGALAHLLDILLDILE